MQTVLNVSLSHSTDVQASSFEDVIEYDFVWLVSHRAKKNEAQRASQLKNR